MAMDRRFEIIFENDELLVLNKPAGLVCHPTKTDERSSLIGRVRLHLGPAARPHLVNRLDRETSGVLLIAKSREAAGELGKLLAGDAVTKTYWAIVHGKPRDRAFTIDAAIGKDESSAVAIKDRVRPDGATARTDVRVLRSFVVQGRTLSWLEVHPATGRKHQIRIHLAHAGHPIVGDKIYGDDETRYLRFVSRTLTDADHAALLMPNHALHARAMAFTWRGRQWTFVAEPDTAFNAMLDACQT